MGGEEEEEDLDKSEGAEAPSIEPSVPGVSLGSELYDDDAEKAFFR